VLYDFLENLRELSYVINNGHLWSKGRLSLISTGD